jgi:hypothetical protein
MATVTLELPIVVTLDQIKEAARECGLSIVEYVIVSRLCPPMAFVAEASTPDWGGICWTYKEAEAKRFHSYDAAIDFSKAATAAGSDLMYTEAITVRVR